MTFEQFKTNVEQWATDRGIYEHSTADAQLLKAVSEIGELADAHIKGDEPEKADGLIDTIVCLVNYAHMERIDFSESMDDVWKILSARTGHMVAGGAFVKDGDV